MFISPRKRRIIKLYSKQFSELTGEPIKIWRERVEKEMKTVDMFWGHMMSTDLQGGTYSYDDGDKKLWGLKSGNYKTSLFPITLEMMKGSTEEDIREYYNIPRFERMLMEWSENTIRDIAVRRFTAEGSTYHDAVIRKWKTFPMYSPFHINGTESLRTDNMEELKIIEKTFPLKHNNYLPASLRPRIDRWKPRIVQELGFTALGERIEEHTTFNAFIMDELRKGNI